MTQQPIKTGWRFRSAESIRERRKRISKTTGQPFFQPRSDACTAWLPVPKPFKKDARNMLMGKIRKTEREAQTGAIRHDLWMASNLALHAGTISKSEFQTDKDINKSANLGKHHTTPSQLAWATRQVTKERGAWADLFDDSIGVDAELCTRPFGEDADYPNHLGDIAARISTPIGGDAVVRDGAFDTASLTAAGCAPSVFGASFATAFSEDLEECMPTDSSAACDFHSIDRSGGRGKPSSRTSGALAELAEKLDSAHRKHVGQDAQYSLEASNDSFGHLQTFYLPPSFSEICAANLALRHENMTIMAANKVLCDRVSLLEDELARARLQMGSFFSCDGNLDMQRHITAGPHFSSDGNTCSHGGPYEGNVVGLGTCNGPLFSCDGNLGFSSLVPLASLEEQNSGSNRQGEEEVELEVSFRVGVLEKRIDKLTRSLGDAVQNSLDRRCSTFLQKADLDKDVRRAIDDGIADARLITAESLQTHLGTHVKELVFSQVAGTCSGFLTAEELSDHLKDHNVALTAQIGELVSASTAAGTETLLGHLKSQFAQQMRAESIRLDELHVQVDLLKTELQQSRMEPPSESLATADFGGPPVSGIAAESAMGVFPTERPKNPSNTGGSEVILTDGQTSLECTVKDDSKAHKEIVDVVNVAEVKRIPIGSIVTTHSLHNVAMNGVMGFVSGFNAARQRYVVRISGAEPSLIEEKLIKAENLEVDDSIPIIGDDNFGFEDELHNILAHPSD